MTTVTVAPHAGIEQAVVALRILPARAAGAECGYGYFQKAADSTSLQVMLQFRQKPARSEVDAVDRRAIQDGGAERRARFIDQNLKMAPELAATHEE